MRGGGVAILSDGRVLAVLGGTGEPDPIQSVVSQTSSGDSWSAPIPVVPSDTDPQLASPPIATPTGAVLVVANQLGHVSYTAFDDATSTWSIPEDTGVEAAPGTAPVVVSSAHGDDAVVLAVTRAGPTWTRRTHGTWITPAVIPGVMTSTGEIYAEPSRVAAVRRAHADTIVAVFGTATDPIFPPSTVTAVTLTGETWSTPVDLATDASAGVDWILAPLRDGRVALAYADVHGRMTVGLFDGSAWGPVRKVPRVPEVGTGGPSIAIVAGRDAGAILELAYVHLHGHGLGHIRLLDDEAWTWSAPLSFSTDVFHGSVALATTPMP